MELVVSGVSLNGAIAQLGERVLCKHEVVGSIPSGSTNFVWNVHQRVLRAQRLARLAIFWAALPYGGARHLKHREEGT